MNGKAGILPGMNLRVTAREGRIGIEPVPRQVQIVQKGPLHIAVPVEEGPALTEATVEQVRRELHGVRQANDWDETATDGGQTGKL